jgi:hypothetical protein
MMARTATDRHTTAVLKQVRADLKEAKRLIGSHYLDYKSGEDPTITAVSRDGFDPWHQILEAQRVFGYETPAERQGGSYRDGVRLVAGHQPLMPGATHVPDGVLYDLLDDLPAGCDSRLRKAMVLCFRIDRALAPLAATPAITEVRLRVGAAWELLHDHLTAPTRAV